MSWGLIAAGLIVLYLLSPTWVKRQEAKDIFDQGISYYDKGEYKKSSEVFFEFAEKFPNDETYIGPALFNLGLSHLFVKDYDKAIASFEILVSSYPDKPEAKSATYYIGECYFQKKEFDKALKTYNEFIGKTDNHSLIIESNFQMYRCYIGKEEYSKANEVLDALSLKYHNQLLNMEINHLKIIQHLKSAQYSSAEDLAEKMLGQPNNPKINHICFTMADSLFEKGKYAQAIGFYQRIKPKEDVLKIIELDMSNPTKSITQDKFSADDWQKAKLEYIRTEIDKSPYPAMIGLYQIGQSYYYQKKYEKATETFSNLINRFPEQHFAQRAYIGLILCHAKMNKPELVNDAVVKFKTEIKDDKQSEEIRFDLLKGLYDEGLYDFIIRESKADTFVFNQENYKEMGLYITAGAYYLADSFTEASELFDKFIKTYPDSKQNIQAKVKYAHCLFKLKKYQETIFQCNQFLKKYSEDEFVPEVVYILAQANFELGNHEASQGNVDTFLAKYSTHTFSAGLIYLKGNMLVSQKKYREAISVFSEIIEKHPEHELVPVAYDQIAVAYYYEKKYDQMEENFRNLKAKYPKSELVPKALYWLGWNKQRNGNIKDAIATYRIVLKSYPQDQWAKESQAAVGDCFVLMKQYQDARNEYVFVLNKWADDTKFAVGVIEKINSVFVEQNKFDEALEVWNNLIKKYKGSGLNSFLQSKLAQTYYFKGDYKTAAGIYDKLKDSKDYYFMAESFLKTNNYRKALNNYLNILSNTVEEQLAKQSIRGISECYLNLKDAGIAEKILKFVNQYPKAKEIIEVSLVVGDIYKSRRQYEQAIPYYQMVITKGKGEMVAQSLVGLGDCLRGLGKYEDAVKVYKRVELLYSQYKVWTEKASEGLNKCPVPQKTKQ